MASTTLNPNAQTFVPEATQAAMTLLDMQRENANLNDAIEALSALSINDDNDDNEINNINNNAVPMDEDLPEPEPIDLQANGDYEYMDAFNEYAQENGLWGYPGAERIPSSNEITEMREAFHAHWLNMMGDDEDEEDEEDEENEENDGWTDIVLDFQDYTAGPRWNLDPNQHDVTHYYEAWGYYLSECWHPEVQDDIIRLGEENNWVGAFPSNPENQENVQL